MRKHPFILLVCLPLFLIGSAGAGVVTENDLCRILKQRGITYDSNAVQRAAVEGILKAIDPGAGIFSAEEAARISTGETSVSAEEWAEDICYMKLNGLYDNGRTQAVARLSEWVKAGKAGVIIDIRGAGGNSLSCVDEIASVFARTNTPMYSVRDYGGKIMETHHARTEFGCEATMNTILLTDQETRDAGETLAAAMDELNGVMLVGMRTKGDAGVRDIIPLSDANKLYLATKWIITPEGKTYDRSGVLPDIVVMPAGTNSVQMELPEARTWGKPLSDKSKQDLNLMKRVAGDPALLRAADILLGLKVLRFHMTEERSDTNSPMEDTSKE